MTETPDLAALTVAHHAITDFSEQRRFYEATLFPALRDHFATLPPADPPVELMIVPVSNKHVPVLVAARWRPRRVVCIYSSFSAKFQSFIEAEIAALNAGVACEGQTVFNIEIEPDRLYKAIREVVQPFIREGQMNPQVAVDITGGTSVMSVGAAMAVSLVGGRHFYILSSTADDDIQQRKVGSEQPRLLPDPYATFGDLERERARGFYHQHDYTAAAERFSLLASRLDDTFGDLSLSKLAAAYAAWDAFDLPGAERRLADLLAAPDSMLASNLVALRSQHAMLARLNRAGGRLLRGEAPTLDLLRDDDLGLALLGSLHANALRREEQGAAEVSGTSDQLHGRLDIAALLRYRCLELLSQLRLAQYGVVTERYDRDRLIHDYHGLNQAYRAAEHAVGFRERGLPFNESLSLLNSYLLLKALNDPLVHNYDLRRIRDRSSSRNKSILAHGFRLITAREYHDFATVVNELIDRFFAIAQRDRLVWEAAYRFVPLA